jgi:lipoic acid synthetase
MLGLGETRAEVEAVLAELAGLGVDIVTLGQYLAPSPQHLPIDRYVHPTELAELEQHARELGITHVVAGPLVRSSYHADGQAQLVRELRAAKGGAPAR